MRNGKGVIGRRVKVRGDGAWVWIVRAITDRFYKLARKFRSGEVYARVPKERVKFVRGNFEAKS